MPPNPAEMRNLRCYVLRYPDLLSGFCQGSLDLCNWGQIASHFDKAGSVEGRCALRHRTFRACHGALAPASSPHALHPLPLHLRFPRPPRAPEARPQPHVSAPSCALCHRCPQTVCARRTT